MKNIKLSFNLFVSFFNSPLGEQIKYYFYFYAVLWLVHLILISIVSYFHLLLNHSISTIGDWIVDRGWTLIIISKLIVALIVYQFLRIKSDYLIQLKSYFKNAILLPKHEMYVCLLFLIVGFISMGQIEWNYSLIFELDRVFLSIMGTFIFFALDFVILVLLGLVFPSSDETSALRKILLFSCLFYLFSYLTFQYEQNVSFKLCALFFLLLYVGIWRRINWTLPFLFLAFFIVPIYSFLGSDPVWGYSFSFFKMIRPISTFYFFILILFAIGYLQYRLKNRTEYIYRE
jgi:hypothetical protein